MTILKNRFFYFKMWKTGFYLAIGNYPKYYLLRIWFEFPKKGRGIYDS